MYKYLPNLVILLFPILFLTSCFIDDDEVLKLPPRQPGAPQLQLLETSIYETQTYYNLETNQTVASNNKIIWDLGFECSDTGWHVILNASKRMTVAGIEIDFENVTSIGAVESDDWIWDKSDGNLDSTAVGQWIDFSTNPPTISNKVYLVNRGYNSAGTQLGYKKFMLLGLENNQYTIRFANMDGSDEHTVQVEKEPGISFVSFSFNNGGERIVLEPQLDTWHLLFEQYTGITYDLLGNPYPYFVQGVLINRRYGLEAMVDTNYLFSEIDYDLATTFEYSPRMDTIGHLWKDVYVDMQTLESVYTCDTSRNHVIKLPNGDYIKLRFLDFYNGNGEKGYTSFEYQKL
ncbi:MAG: hypothetical protein GXO79_00320 [Chlorobi bacterium]|nr:hypothetical protein [Chlorobiota bacterium]